MCKMYDSLKVSICRASAQNSMLWSLAEFSGPCSVFRIRNGRKYSFQQRSLFEGVCLQSIRHLCPPRWSPWLFLRFWSRDLLAFPSLKRYVFQGLWRVPPPRSKCFAFCAKTCALAAAWRTRALPTTGFIERIGPWVPESSKVLVFIMVSACALSKTITNLS